jgi:AcrR family transcriptional regulator
MGRIKQISDDVLLQTARELFVAKGFGVSTREIAKTAGISEAVIYQRFATKQALFFAAMVPPMIGNPSDGAEYGSGNFQVELEKLALDIMDYFRKAMPVFLKLITHPECDPAKLAIEEKGMPFYSIKQRITDCILRNSKNVDMEKMNIAVLTLISTLHSLAIFEKIGIHGGSFPEKAVKNIVRLIIAGLNNETEKH